MLVGLDTATLRPINRAPHVKQTESAGVRALFSRSTPCGAGAVFCGSAIRAVKRGCSRTWDVKLKPPEARGGILKFYRGVLDFTAALKILKRL